MRPETTVSQASPAAKWIGVFAVGSALSATIYAAPSLAQTSMPAIGPEGGGGRRMNVEVRGRVLYDSAVTRSPPPGSPPGTLRQWDVLYSPGVSMDIVQPLGSFYTYVQGRAGYEFYQRNPKLNSTRLNLSTGAGGALGPCNLEVTGAWARGQIQVQDLTLGVTQNEQEVVSAGLQANCATSSGFFTQAGVQVTRVDNSAARGVVDNEGINYNAGAGYGNPALGTIQAIVQYQRSDYMYEDIPVGVVPSPGVDVVNYGLQYERPIGRRLLGRVGVGYSVVDVRSGTDDKNGSYTADVSLTYTPNRRVVGNLAYRRNASPSTLTGIDYILLESVDAQVTYRLTPRLQAQFGGSWTDRSYKGQIDPLLVGAPQNEEVVRGSLGVSLRVGRKSTISLDGAYQDRRTNVPELSYDSVQAGLTVATSF
jgi:hypothetical protein